MKINVEQLLPIGSVVLLQGGEKRLMTFGVVQEDPETHEVYDYAGIVYPEGNVGIDSAFLFNHDEIEEVFFVGYNDIERQEFIAQLTKIITEGEDELPDEDASK